MWKGAWGAYQDPNTVVMSSRKMRAWLLDDPPFAKHYLAMKPDKAKVGCLRDGMQNKTTLNGKKEEEEAPATDQYFLYKCSCGRYRHYAWCLHVMCRAVYDDLVWKPYRPKTMDSAKVLSVRKCGGAPAESGRHAKARKGGALDKRQ
jgi:hypothetical protein